MTLRLACFCGAALALLAASAHAQRVDDNAITQAGEIFGYTLADQSVGVYSSNNVRGFDPNVANNLRVDGLYVDELIADSHAYRSQSIRVGLSALDFAFRAPSGIIDTSLAGADHENFTTIALGVGNYSDHFFGPISLNPSVDFDHEGPDHAWSISGGFNLPNTQVGPNGNRSTGVGGALVPRLRLSDHWNLTGLLAYGDTPRSDQPPEYFLPADALLPPVIARVHNIQPEWLTVWTRGGTVGAILDGTVGAWQVKGDLFFGGFAQAGYVTLLSGITPDGLVHAEDVIGLNPRTSNRSLSGEWRAQRNFKAEGWDNNLVLSVRGRSSVQYYGNNADYSYDQVQSVNAPLPFQPPPPQFTPPDRDSINQVTGGVSWRSSSSDFGMINVDVQKTRFTKSFTVPGAPTSDHVDEPWLFGAEVGVKLSSTVTSYAAYTHGLEDSGAAPNSATNANQALAPAVTTQYEAGLRFAPTKQLNLVAGVFDLSKPYAGIDPANVYGFVGHLTNRGAELSIDDALTEQLHVLLGGYLLHARIAAPDANSADAVGPIPIGLPDHDVQLNIDYHFKAVKSLSLNATVENTGAQASNIASTHFAPSHTTVSVGGVYRFKLLGKSASCRLNLTNLLNNYSWSVNPDGSFLFNPPRSFYLTLRTEL